ncbi:MAG TPA: HNH endonuclease [Steroidobacteraceae bacterium]|nr:HNH endonuclease [Steroidobacteraceae bacterium]
MSARIWWANHSESFRHELDGGYLWFAGHGERSKTGSENARNVARLLPGDAVLMCVAGTLSAVGVVLATAMEAATPDPDEPAARANGSKRGSNGSKRGANGRSGAQPDTGWLVPVRLAELSSPLAVEDHCAEFIAVLPKKHSPLRASGIWNQHVRLAAVSESVVGLLDRLLDGEAGRLISAITESAGRGLAEDAQEAMIQQRKDLDPARKTALLKARYGQGLFRANVESREHACRITGVLDRRHLRAVHIKPWSDCDDGEKLDGFNGFLMSPHVAHLFSRGYISFADDGSVLVSNDLNLAVLASWWIELPRSAGALTPEQRYYLDYHRREVFDRHGGGRRQRATDYLDEPAVPPDAEPAVVNPA